MKLSYLHDLVIANRILANEGVVDAFGHVSIRNPEKCKSILPVANRERRELVHLPTI